MSDFYNKQDQSLRHFGVLGMKWGHRRARRGKKYSEDYKQVKELKKKKIYELSNRDLQKINNRKILEKNYRQLNPKLLAVGLAATTAGIKTINSISNNYKNISRLSKQGKKYFKRMIRK